MWRVQCHLLGLVEMVLGPTRHLLPCAAQSQPWVMQKLYGGKTFFDEWVEKRGVAICRVAVAESASLVARWIFFDETDPSHGCERGFSVGVHGTG